MELCDWKVKVRTFIFDPEQLRVEKTEFVQAFITVLLTH